MMISLPMIQIGEIAEVMFLLFPYLDYGRFCSVKSPNGTHVTQLLGTRLGLLASICQSNTRNQVMTRDSNILNQSEAQQ